MTHQTTCCYCGVGCGIVVKQEQNGRLTVEGDQQHPSNRGLLCSKGMNLHYTVMDQSDRLLYPQMRLNRSMPMQRVSWDAALERTAAVFKTFIQKYGPDSVAFYVSGQCLTEEYYLVNKLIKGLHWLQQHRYQLPFVHELGGGGLQTITWGRFRAGLLR
jgi:ferredoxin-nitrate reductase